MTALPLSPRARSAAAADPTFRRRVARRSRTVRDRVLSAGRDRGDVPGWVLVTLMTAGLVLALWALAGPALTSVFSDSIARVTGAIGG